MMCLSIRSYESQVVMMWWTHGGHGKVSSERIVVSPRVLSRNWPYPTLKYQIPSELWSQRVVRSISTGLGDRPGTCDCQLLSYKFSFAKIDLIASRRAILCRSVDSTNGDMRNMWRWNDIFRSMERERGCDADCICNGQLKRRWCMSIDSKAEYQQRWMQHRFSVDSIIDHCDPRLGEGCCVVCNENWCETDTSCQ